MIRVLHVVQSLDPAWGGIARVLPDLAAGLSGHDVQSTIVTLAGGRYGTPPAPASDAPVRIERFPASQGRLGHSRACAAALKALIPQNDVVHLHGLWTAQNRVAARVARRARKPYLMTPHSMMMPWAWNRSWWKKRPIGWWFEHANLRRAACIHALSEGEAAAIRALGFNERVEIIPNGIWPRDYAGLPAADALCEKHPALRDRRWLLFMSRIHWQKGIVPLMQACFDAAALAGDWQLVIAGPDEIGLQPRLEAAVTRKGLRDRVTFLGMLDRRGCLAALGRAELLLQPSLSEGLSMSILEALAAGVPVIISPACNMPEVAAADAGRVVEPERRAIAAALREVLSLSESDRREMGQRARRLVAEQFSWDALLPRYRALYAQILGRALAPDGRRNGLNNS